MTTFVDIVGRSCNSGSDKDVIEGWMVNLCYEMSSICMNKAESSYLMSLKSSYPVGGVTNSKSVEVKDTNIITK